MGMYTEFYFRAELDRRRTPREVIVFLDKWFNHEHIQMPPLPEHPFFESSRWEMVLNGGSAYFPAPPYSAFIHQSVGDHWELGIHSNLKNYGQEITLFLDWINPYVFGMEGTFLGYSLYEEGDDPVLHFKDKVKGFAGP